MLHKIIVIVLAGCLGISPVIFIVAGADTLSGDTRVWKWKTPESKPPKAPEIDASTVPAMITLLVGGLAVMSDRRKR